MSRGTVIVGAGQAGDATAFRLRALGYQGPITIVGDEPVAAYQRPPLSKKQLMSDAPPPFLKAAEAYEKEGIVLKTGMRVCAIDRAAQSVQLADGTLLPYDSLVLATGTRPRLLPQEAGGKLDGVHVLRTLADAQRLATSLKSAKCLLILGGGYIGLEVAATARLSGLEVTLVEKNPRILRRVAGEQIASYFRELHCSRGVTLLEGRGLETLIEANGHVAGARLDDGSVIEADLVLAGIGSLPNVELAEQAGLQVSDGIVVDAFGRSSDSAIYAIGDCASFPWQDGRLRLESVQNAEGMARTVAGAIAGQAVEYMPVPWFWSDQYDVKLQIAGISQGYDSVVTRPGAREGSMSVWYFRGDEFLAVDAVNDAAAFLAGRKMLENKIRPMREAIADTKLALKDIAARAQEENTHG